FTSSPRSFGACACPRREPSTGRSLQRGASSSRSQPWGNTMKTRRRMDGASFGPDALKAMGEAFDAAWEHVRESFGADPLIIEAARLALADALLSVASDGSRDVGVLARAALEVMAMSYRRDRNWRPRAVVGFDLG